MRVIASRALNFTVGRTLDANGNVTDPGKLYTIPPGNHVVPDEVRLDPSWAFCVANGVIQEIETVAHRASPAPSVTVDPSAPFGGRLPGPTSAVPIQPIIQPSAGADAAAAAAAAPVRLPEQDQEIKPVVQPKPGQPFVPAPAPLAPAAPDADTSKAETQKD
jgi:hypothetical protein